MCQTFPQALSWFTHMILRHGPMLSQHAPCKAPFLGSNGHKPGRRTSIRSDLLQVMLSTGSLRWVTLPQAPSLISHLILMH